MKLQIKLPMPEQAKTVKVVRFKANEIEEIDEPKEIIDPFAQITLG